MVVVEARFKFQVGNQLSIVDQDGSELLGISCGLQLPPGEV